MTQQLRGERHGFIIVMFIVVIIFFITIAIIITVVVAIIIITMTSFGDTAFWAAKGSRRH